MKLTKSHLIKLIKEELEKLSEEGEGQADPVKRLKQLAADPELDGEFGIDKGEYVIKGPYEDVYREMEADLKREFPNMRYEDTYIYSGIKASADLSGMRDEIFQDTDLHARLRDLEQKLRDEGDTELADALRSGTFD